MTEPTSEHHDDHEQHGSMGLYIFVFVALCVLTTMSFLTYSDLWRLHVSSEVSRVFMMAVSCTKAMLVIMFFMHLKWEANWKWVLTVPASVMSVLLIFALIPDVGLRMRHASHTRMIHAAEEPAESDHEAEDQDGPEADSPEIGH
ncbi:MAG: cytochrome C oxidase subunit IV family protein [Planctomycetes bacterium]|nr:cytochrome C oxidase subunit IV family protein [Planctomycetota bacterium]